MLPFENTSGCYEVAGKYPDKVKIGTQDLPDPPDQLDPSDSQHSQHRQHRQHPPDQKTPCGAKKVALYCRILTATLKLLSRGLRLFYVVTLSAITMFHSNEMAFIG